MFISIVFLPDTVFSCSKYLCVTMHPYSHISEIPCFMALPPDLLCDSMYKFPWDATSKIPR